MAVFRNFNTLNIVGTLLVNVFLIFLFFSQFSSIQLQIERMDYSKYDFPNELWIVIPDWEMAVKIGTFVPIILLGIIGNTIMLNIIIRNRALQTPTNLLLANMSAADLATLAICPILFMFNNFCQDFRLGVVGCKAEGFLEGAFLVTAVFNLCAVSYDRLTAIVLPMETRLTVKGAKIVMIISWLVGCILALPLAVFRFYKERQWKNYLETFCSESPDVLPLYWHGLIAAIVWLPLIVMVLCYSAILWKLDRYEQKVLKREHPICVSYKMKVAKTLFVVVLTFVVLRVPFTALIIMRTAMLSSQSVINQVNGSFAILWYASHYLIFLNAAVNPLIYGLTNDNFRRAYHQTPIFLCCKKPHATFAKVQSRPHLQLFRNLQPRPPCNLTEHNKLGQSGMWMWFNTNKDRLRISTNASSSKATITTHIKIISKDAPKSMEPETKELHSNEKYRRQSDVHM